MRRREHQWRKIIFACSLSLLFLLPALGGRASEQCVCVRAVRVRAHVREGRWMHVSSACCIVRAPGQKTCYCL